MAIATLFDRRIVLCQYESFLKAGTCIQILVEYFVLKFTKNYTFSWILFLEKC